MTSAILLLAMALPTGAPNAGEPLMLDFTAEWCGPCRQMRPAVDQLIKNGYPVKPVDLDDNPDLAERYQVKEVPTFVVIDPDTGKELARTSGAQPVGQLASLYKEARAKFLEDAAPAEEVVAAEEVVPAEDAPRPANSPNPKPWETVVRIKVHGQGSIGFGSGTLIYSTPGEALILTCAHIFHMEGRRQVPPSRFPLKITVDLFDGNLQGRKPAQVRYANETYEGEALDYDFAKDIGLIRIRPKRRLPYARVVPAHWQPKAKMRMTTVGCSEGNDATAWSTVILNPSMKGLQGNGAYEAIECAYAPKQGRSGGGLFTDDGYVAGVCDFAEPRGDRGLYATPNSIYQMLDRNKLMALYAPVESAPGDSGRLLASAPATQGGRRRAVEETEIARGQSPDAPARGGPGSVSLPPPEMLGIKPPILVSRRPERQAPARRSAWAPAPTAVAADLQMDKSLDTDRFGSVRDAVETEARDEDRRAPEAPAQPVAAPASRPAKASGWKPVRTPLAVGAEAR